MSQHNEIRINVFAPTAPHKGQQAILDALDMGERFVLLRAGRKFRKTSLIISWLFEKAFETGLTCPYVAPNRIQAKNIAWDDHVSRILDELIEHKVPYKKNEVELSIKLPNGGKVQLLGVENKEALRGISNWGAFGGDEIDDWSEDIWPTIIRPNLMVHKAPAILGGTPKGYRHMYRLENSGLFKPFHFTSFDNPDLDPQELADMVEEYKKMGEAYYRQEVMAEYEKPVGTVYGDWDMERQYVPFAYDPNLPVHLTWDFGVNDPTAIWFIQPNGHEIRAFDYYEAANANLEHFTQVIAAKGYKVPAFEAGDIAGRAKDLTTGKSPIQELSRLGHHVRTNSIPDIPTQVRHAHKYIPRLYVSSSNPDCERIRDCIVNYRYPEKPTTVVNQSNEVPIHDQYSHAMRAFEYYCWNLYDPKVNIEDNPPVGSIGKYLKNKKEEEYLKEEYVGY
jgi:hypothetical protein